MAFTWRARSLRSQSARAGDGVASVVAVRPRGTQPEGRAVREPWPGTSVRTRRALRRAPVPGFAAAPRNGTSTEPLAPWLRPACGGPARSLSPLGDGVLRHEPPRRPSEGPKDPGRWRRLRRFAVGGPQPRSQRLRDVPFCGAAAKSGTGARRSVRRVLRRCRPRLSDRTALGLRPSRPCRCRPGGIPPTALGDCERSERVRCLRPYRPRKGTRNSLGGLARFARNRLALGMGLRQLWRYGRAVRNPRAGRSESRGPALPLGRGAHSVARLCLVSRLRRETAQARSLWLRGCGPPAAGLRSLRRCPLPPLRCRRAGSGAAGYQASARSWAVWRAPASVRWTSS